MTMRIYVCDRCGETIAEGRSLLRAEAGPIRDRWAEIDLCRPCEAGLRTWLAEGGESPAAA